MSSHTDIQLLLQQVASAEIDGLLEDQRDYVFPSSRMRWGIEVSSPDFTLLTDSFMDDVLNQEGARKPTPIALRDLKMSMTTICANLLLNSIIGKHIKLQVSYNKSSYTHLPVGYVVFHRVLNVLIANGFVRKVYDGRHFPDLSLESRISPTEKLLDNFDRLDVSISNIVINAPANVTVRDPQSGVQRFTAEDERPVPQKIKAMLKSLKAINDGLRSSSIGLDIAPERLATLHHQTRLKSLGEDSHDDEEHFVDFTEISYRRIFNSDDLNRGGRFYGPWWQTVPSKYRRFITIDGLSTVELDFKAIHPTLAYARLGIALTNDPYTIDLTHIGLPHSATSEYGEAWRPVVKYVINAHLNSLTGLYEKFPDFDTLGKQCGVIWADFKREVLNKHPALAGLVGVGIELQRVDSDIAEDVMLHFTRKDIPCLSVHDSFIVAATHSDELMQVMLDAFVKHSGVRPVGIS